MKMLKRLTGQSGKKKPEDEIRDALVLWTILTVFFIGGDVFLAVRGMSLSDLVPYLIVTVFFVLMELFVIYWFYKDCVKPKITLEKSGDSSMEKRLALTKKRKKGKDMFEIVDAYRYANILLTIVLVFVVSFLLSAAVVAKINGYDYGPHLPYYWVFIVALIFSVIGVIVTIKYGRFSLTSEALKSVIAAHGYDEMRVNNDFMMASYHDMTGGLMAIGISYFVYFTLDKCYVGEIRNIRAVETFSETQKQSDTEITKDYVRVYEKDNTSRTFLCDDDISAQLIAREFENLGISVSDRDANRGIKKEEDQL